MDALFSPSAIMIAAEASGVNTTYYKTLAFAFSALPVLQGGLRRAASALWRLAAWLFMKPVGDSGWWLFWWFYVWFRCVRTVLTGNPRGSTCHRAGCLRNCLDSGHDLQT